MAESIYKYLIIYISHRNVSKPLNVISFTATADTLYVHVPVAIIAKEKYSANVHFNTNITSQFLTRSNKKTEIFKATGLSKCLHLIICV
jgi:hypothetical protein